MDQQTVTTPQQNVIHSIVNTMSSSYKHGFASLHRPTFAERSKSSTAHLYARFPSGSTHTHKQTHTSVVNEITSGWHDQNHSVRMNYLAEEVSNTSLCIPPITCQTITGCVCVINTQNFREVGRWPKYRFNRNRNTHRHTNNRQQHYAQTRTLRSSSSPILADRQKPIQHSTCACNTCIWVCVYVSRSMWVMPCRTRSTMAAAAAAVFAG